MATNLQGIYTKQSGPAASISADIAPMVEERGSGSGTPRSTPGGTPRRRMLLDPQATDNLLKSGATDFLGLGSGKASLSSRSMTAESDRKGQEGGWKLVREFLYAQNDRVVHFSGEHNEVLGNLPIKRFLVVTDNAVYRIPQSTIDTGIFFDCRTPLERISQVITQDAKMGSDGQDLDAQVQCYLTDLADPGAAHRKTELASKSAPFFTISFGSASARRKAFLLALCAARPTLSILQKRFVPDAVPQYETGQSGGRLSRTSPRPEVPKASTRSMDRKASNPWGPVERRLELKSLSKSPTASFTCSPPKGDTGSARKAPSPTRAASSGSFAYPPVPLEPTEEEFVSLQAKLREALSETSAMGLGTYDYEKVARRPVEEDDARRIEREKIKAELDSREAKIVQNIQWKIKYPQKVPTRVPPGTEFDKAHEERHVLPDDFTDEELLGPSLFPLWRQWKATGGLMGHDGIPENWSLYDSQDLVDSLRSREEVLFGVVGRASLKRVASMCELVDRERQMFLNKKSYHEREAAAEDERQGSDREGSQDRSMGRARSTGSLRSPGSFRGGPSPHGAPTTKPVPFNLSQSQTALRKLKIIDSKRIVQDMKKNFENHMKAMHELQKEQLTHQLQRVQQSGE